jgi:hypothetical protein
MVPEESARHTEPARLRSAVWGAAADDIVEQLAERGDADDLEVDIADAESFAVGVGGLHDARHTAARGGWSDTV